MELVGSEFVERILAVKNIWWPARDIVRTAIENRHEVREGGREGGRKEGGRGEGGKEGGREGGMRMLIKCCILSTGA